MAPEAQAATPTLALIATAVQKPISTPIPSFTPTPTRQPVITEQKPTASPTVSSPTAALTKEPAPAGEFTLDATNVKFDKFTGQPIKCLVDPTKIWQSYWQLPLAEGQTWSKVKALQVKISVGDMERILQIKNGQLVPIPSDDPQKGTEGLPLPPETEGNLLKVNIFTDNNPTRTAASYQKEGKWIEIGQQFPIYRTETGAMGGKDLCR